MSIDRPGLCVHFGDYKVKLNFEHTVLNLSPIKLLSKTARMHYNRQQSDNYPCVPCHKYAGGTKISLCTLGIYGLQYPVTLMRYENYITATYLRYAAIHICMKFYYDFLLSEMGASCSHDRNAHQVTTIWLRGVTHQHTRNHLVAHNLQGNTCIYIVHVKALAKAS